MPSSSVLAPPTADRGAAQATAQHAILRRVGPARVPSFPQQREAVREPLGSDLVYDSGEVP
eukprot:7246093-Pyramimonas_sp.AAC.1